jgi:hypothetical protein
MDFRKRNGREKGKNFLIDRHTFSCIQVRRTTVWLRNVQITSALYQTQQTFNAQPFFSCKDLCSFID